ncbi:MAG: hypothetical protein AAB074_17935 [Planctomycetota bacterium]
MTVRSHVPAWLLTISVVAIGGCSKAPSSGPAAGGGGTGGGSSKTQLPPLVERARAFDSEHPWKDFDEQERATLLSALPEIVMPSQMVESSEPPALNTLLDEFEKYVRNSDSGKKNAMVVQKVADFRQACIRQLKSPDFSQLPGMPRQGGWFEGQVEAEAKKIVDAIAEYHQVMGQKSLNTDRNAASRRMAESWAKAKDQVASIRWEPASFRTTLVALCESISTMQKNKPENVLNCQGVPHPKVSEYREPFRKLAKAVTDKACVYSRRLPYFRLKHYAAAAEANAAGRFKDALDLATRFMGSEPGIDLTGVDPTLHSIACEDTQAEVDQLVVAAKGIIKGLRGRVSPETATQAVIMYEARDLRGKFGLVENAPGTWCLYSGEYEGTKSGYHLIRVGKVDYVAFEASEDLSHVPDGVTMTVMGQYEQLIEYRRVIGSTGRAPLLKDSLVFRQR